ncbi:MAG TPA: RNA polymerase sigma factor [Polyangiaceae bacterium]|nr:RNA polymerase sigma factor [Polyangiaceae bacterium]
MPPFNAALETPPAQGAEGGAASFLSPREFEALYSAYFHHVTRWARAFGCPQADIDDVAQETFLVARRRLDQFQGGNAAGWLYRIAQHVSRSHRRRAWLRRMLDRSPEATPSEARHPNPVEALEQREARRLMQTLLLQMTERRRTTFFLFEIEGYSGEEIAQLEGVAVTTVYTRLHHARRDFMNLLARAEGEEPRE